MYPGPVIQRIVLHYGRIIVDICIVNDEERQLTGSFGREGRNNKDVIPRMLLYCNPMCYCNPMKDFSGISKDILNFGM